MTRLNWRMLAKPEWKATRAIGKAVSPIKLRAKCTRCVRATATDAKTYHLKPLIIREAVQDRSEIAHEWTLFDIQARFADVVSLEETVNYLRS